MALRQFTLRPVPSLDEIRKAREGTIARNLLNQFEPVAIGTLITTRCHELGQSRA